MKWCCKLLNDMTGLEAYQVFKLREQVFTIGQQCTEADIDDIDLNALHFYAYEGDQLLAYMRIYDKNNVKNLGRILVNPEYQGRGYGRALMKQALLYLDKHHLKQPIHMSAQLYLKQFYQSLGFVSSGTVYQEAGIDHIFMLLQ